VHSPAGLLLFSVTTQPEGLPQAPPLVKSRVSKCTLLFKNIEDEKMASFEGYEEVFKNMKKCAPFQPQINL